MSIITDNEFEEALREALVDYTDDTGLPGSVAVWGEEGKILVSLETNSDLPKVANLAIKAAGHASISAVYLAFECRVKKDATSSLVEDMGLSSDTFFMIYALRKFQAAKLGIVSYQFNRGKDCIDLLGEINWDNSYFLSERKDALHALSMEMEFYQSN